MEADGSLTGPDGGGGAVAGGPSRGGLGHLGPVPDREHRSAAFFRFLVDCPSLRWFQSPAAGYDSRAVPADGRARRPGLQRPRQQPAHRRVRAAGRARRVPGGGEWRRQAEHVRVAHPRLAGGGGHHVAGRRARPHRRRRGRPGPGARRHGHRVPAARRPPTTRPTGWSPRTSWPSVVGEADVVVLSAPANAGTAPAGRCRLPGGHATRAACWSTWVGAAWSTRTPCWPRSTPARRRPPCSTCSTTSRCPPDHPFWTHPRVRVTPHNAAGGFGRLQRQADLFAANLDRWLAGRPPGARRDRRHQGAPTMTYRPLPDAPTWFTRALGGPPGRPGRRRRRLRHPRPDLRPTRAPGVWSSSTGAAPTPTGGPTWPPPSPRSSGSCASTCRATATAATDRRTRSSSGPTR